MTDDQVSEGERVGVEVTSPRLPRGELPEWYPALLDSVATRVTSGQRSGHVAVNRELLTTYWGIGRDILDRQEDEG